MKRLVGIVHAISAALLVVAVVINCANVIGRYAFSYPFASAEEVMLFLLVGIVFFGNSVVAFQGRQIRMDILVQAMPLKIRRWLDIVADVAAIVMSGILIVLGWPAISMLAEFDQRSQAADFPLVVPQSAIPIGFALTILFLCLRVIISLKTINEPPASADIRSH
jgi:TRAP-type C4-dicarboxylate transport system permease small subunit